MSEQDKEYGKPVEVPSSSELEYVDPPDHDEDDDDFVERESDPDDFFPPADAEED